MSDKTIIVSNQTRQKVEAAKNYIQQRYSKLIEQQIGKKQYWQKLNQKMKIMNIPNLEREEIKNNILHKQAEKLRIERKKITVLDFDSVKIVGKGAFGQVRLCRWIRNNQPVAVKKLKKSQMIFKNKVIQVREERNVLVNSENNPWIVGLKCSFQDIDHLYLVMDYIPGGDLMNLLIKKDIFTHDQARFYIAEMILAIQSVHRLKYIHRDIKPDNILIDQRGHIKLSDFGLCKHTEVKPKKLMDNIRKKQTKNANTLKNQTIDFKDSKHKRKLAYSAVGTPDYVAPEVQGKNGYNQTVDWWSLGVIFYEMLVGYAPFASEDSSITWQKIQNWRKYLVIPKQVYVSPQANDLIKKLVNDPHVRLGVNGVEEIKAHPFFYGVDWNRIRQKKAPNIPILKNPFDTSNFDPFQEEEPWILPKNYKGKNGAKKGTEFIGYTFKPQEDTNSELIKALVDLDNYRQPQQLHRNNVDSMGLDPVGYDRLQRNVFKKEKVETKKEFYLTTTTVSPKHGYSNRRQQLTKGSSPSNRLMFQKKSPTPFMMKDDRKITNINVGPRSIMEIRK